jgi:hypothetical protein
LAVEEGVAVVVVAYLEAVEVGVLDVIQLPVQEHLVKDMQEEQATDPILFTQRAAAALVRWGKPEYLQVPHIILVIRAMVEQVQ